MVHPSFLAEAQELLDSPISEEDLFAEAMVLPPEFAPSKETEDYPLRKKR